MRRWAFINLNFYVKLALTAAVFLLVYTEIIDLRADEMKATTDCQADIQRQSPNGAAIESSPSSDSYETRKISPQGDTRNSVSISGQDKCSAAVQKGGCPTSIQEGPSSKANPPCSSDTTNSEATGARRRRGVPMQAAPTTPPHVSPVEGQKDLIEVIRPNTTVH
jgi:hypothetical protein